MSNLYIHCGLPKTGTSALQEYLAASRPNLRALGYDYPEIGTEINNTAHHNLARELQNGSGFLPERGSTLDFLRYIEGSKYSNTILSTEGFTHCLLKNPSTFAGFLQSVSLKNDAFKIIFTFRNFSKMAESTYLHHLTRGFLTGKNGRPSSPARAGNYLGKLFANLEMLYEAFGENRFVALDNERFGGDSISALQNLLGISPALAQSGERRANEKLGLKKTAFLYQIQFFPDGSPRMHFRDLAIDNARKNLSKAPELPDEIYNYRVTPYKDAKAIQKIARKKMPAFLLKSLERSAESDLPYYDACDLGNLVLPKAEFEELQQSLPDRIRETNRHNQQTG